MSPELPRDTTLDLWMEYLETKGDYGYRSAPLLRAARAPPPPPPPPFRPPRGPPPPARSEPTAAECVRALFRCVQRPMKRMTYF